MQERSETSTAPLDPVPWIVAHYEVRKSSALMRRAPQTIAFLHTRRS